jgi:hypothetical protein
MEVMDKVVMTFPESVDAEKVIRAVMAYVRSQKADHPEYKDFESHLKVTSSLEAGQPTRTYIVSGPKPVVNRFKALTAELLRELAPGNSSSK